MQPGKHPWFAPAEFQSRVARLRERMQDIGVDVALFDEIEAMTWLSGFGNSENRWRCVVIPMEGEPFFLIRALDATPCRERSWITDVPTFRDWEDPLPVLVAALTKRGMQGARIGLDLGSYCMPVARFNQGSKTCVCAAAGCAAVWSETLIRERSQPLFPLKENDLADRDAGHHEHANDVAVRMVQLRHVRIGGPRDLGDPRLCRSRRPIRQDRLDRNV